MNIELRITNKQLFGLVLALVMVGAVGYVQSYGGTQPSVVGHTAGELDLIGAVTSYFDSSKAEYTQIGHGGSNGYINTVGDGRLDFRHDGNNLMSLLDNGRVGIGTTNPTNYIDWPASLQVNGEIRAARYYDDEDTDADGIGGPDYYIDINSNSYMNALSLKGSLYLPATGYAGAGQIQSAGVVRFASGSAAQGIYAKQIRLSESWATNDAHDPGNGGLYASGNVIIGGSLTLACPSGWSSKGHICYKQYAAAKWSEANDQCQSVGSRICEYGEYRYIDDCDLGDTYWTNDITGYRAIIGRPDALATDSGSSNRNCADATYDTDEYDTSYRDFKYLCCKPRYF